MKEIIISVEEAQCLDVLLELGVNEVEHLKKKPLLNVNLPSDYFDIVNNFLKRCKVVNDEKV